MKKKGIPGRVCKECDNIYNHKFARRNMCPACLKKKHLNPSRVYHLTRENGRYRYEFRTA